MPLTAFVPVHVPPAVQEVGLLVADHAIVALLPVVMLAGLIEIVTTGIAITVSVADFVSDPAALLHARV